EPALKIIQDAKALADESIRNFNKYGQAQAPMREMEQERTKLRNAMAEKERSLSDTKKQSQAPNMNAPKKLHIGDTVRVLSMNLTGTVQTLPNAKGNLFVQMGILRSQVNIKDLVLLPDAKPSIAKQGGASGSSGIKMSKSSTISAELKLIGKTVDEALPELDKYLDDAYLAHLSSVRIVHGKGTGALRKAVHNHLRSYPHVKSYHLGEYGEGDAGVTIVEFE
ncbi:MAG: Smr/MutS family protein, partial [Clostridiales bacterium]|nr:Smr/MutS family protein [Clostridiales bacterium]